MKRFTLSLIFITLIILILREYGYNSSTLESNPNLSALGPNPIVPGASAKHIEVPSIPDAQSIPHARSLTANVPVAPNIMSSPGVLMAWNSKEKTCFIRQDVLRDMIRNILKNKESISFNEEYGWIISSDAMSWSFGRCAKFRGGDWHFTFKFIDGISVSTFSSFEEGLSRILTPGPHELGEVISRRSGRPGQGLFIVVVDETPTSDRRINDP